ncbi:MAG: endonuclease [Desulfuromonas sp.]|uniref:thermonuclease family protein n=1 Tax=Desulfuromonas sp. TaxID=892 RepID=UPI000CA79B7B|nr:thermonuclease family protein [Desulfuromonas sp.]PLX86594.1 MAG: endonuclease [Desulfuromonas sp.]
MKSPRPPLPHPAPSITPLILFLLALLLALLLLAGCAGADTEQITGRVTWVYDGDTLEVEGAGKVRLIGIDTPEREASGRDRFFREKFDISSETLRRGYRQALQFNIATAKGNTVRLEFDREKRDRHDRLLAYVTLPDGRLLNRLLLQKGLAVVYRRFGFRLKDDFLRAEAQARKEGTGLWKR